MSSERVGWICPKCRAALSPDKDRCDCSQVTFAPGTTTTLSPAWWPKTICTYPGGVTAIDPSAVA
jgi:hypothetical protein